METYLILYIAVIAKKSDHASLTIQLSHLPEKCSYDNTHSYTINKNDPQYQFKETREMDAECERKSNGGDYKNEKQFVNALHWLNII